MRHQLMNVNHGAEQHQNFTRDARKKRKKKSRLDRWWTVYCPALAVPQAEAMTENTEERRGRHGRGVGRGGWSGRRADREGF